jgi:predicted permease
MCIRDRYIPSLAPDAYKKVNKWIIWIPLPAIMLEKISRIEFNSSHVAPILSAWGLFLFGLVFFGILSKIFKWNLKTWAAMSLVCGLGNTSFIGYPVTRMLFGEAGMDYAILVDQPGTFFALATGGILLAAYAGTGKFSVGLIFKQVMKFPPFIAFAIALIIPAKVMELPISASEISISDIIHPIGLFLNPMAFFSLGMQFRFTLQGISPLTFFTGLSYKLILAPAFFGGLLYLANIQGLMLKVTIIELAMPPMITASIIASEYQLRPHLSAAWINIGIPLSAITLTGWAFLLL